MGPSQGVIQGDALSLPILGVGVVRVLTAQLVPQSSQGSPPVPRPAPHPPGLMPRPGTHLIGAVQPG